MNSKKNIPVLGFIAILVFYSCTYYREMLFNLPYSIHDWAQADRLSIAISFFDKGMNFFKPRTFNLFPIDGIVGVEFPIQSYTAAILGHIFGRQNISTCFRALDLAIACIGLLFLFLACFKTTKDFIFSIITPLFIFSSPVYCFYACNYLSDATAASVVFIAFYFMLDYLQSQNIKKFLQTIILLTLATLMKTSEGIYLMGFLIIIIFLLTVNNPANNKKHTLIILTAFILSFTIILCYYNYDNYLNKHYKSDIFLSSILPFTDWGQISYYFNYSFKYQWVDQYFVLPQYLMFLSVFTPSVYFLWKEKTGRIQLLLQAIFLSGALIFAYLFGSQLLVHDYYIVSIFFPLFAFILLTGIIAIHKYCNKEGVRALRISLLSAIIITFFFADFQLNRRLQPNTREVLFFQIPWSKGGDKILDKLKIPKNENILVFNEDAPNTHLLYFDRKGYNIPPSWYNNDMIHPISLMNEKHLRIMVASAEMVHCLEKENPAIFKAYNLLYISDKIAVFELI